MKAQMRFQKYICLAMLILGAITLVYAFCYCSGSLSDLGRLAYVTAAGEHLSYFAAADGKWDALLYEEIQDFNNQLMFFGLAMIIFAVILYITGCHKRRNYYISNYVAIGLCAVGDLVLSVIALIQNAIWRGAFLEVDFASWASFNNTQIEKYGETVETYYSESTAWFDVGFVVYIIMIIAVVFLILNLVWKIKLMQGEKKLLNNSACVGGVA